MLANDSSAYDAYGQSMSLFGAHLLVGAELANSDSAHKSGAVYLETNLIPYFVAATQSKEEEEVNNGPGDDDGATDDADSDAETSWSAFVVFCQSSGGIVTMSFLPVAVLILACLAHSKAKGHTVISKEYVHDTCTSWQASIGAGAGAGSGCGGGGNEDDPMMMKGIDRDRHGSVSPSDAEVLTTVFDNSVAESASLREKGSSVSFQRARAQSSAGVDHVDETGVAHVTPSLWQRMQHFVRNPFLQTALHVPLAHSDSATAAFMPADVVITSVDAAKVTTPVLSAPTTSGAGSATTTTDFRLCAPGHSCQDAHGDNGLSIRSPITHIPRHAQQMLSPHGKDPSPTYHKGTVNSYRIVEQHAPPLEGSLMENKPPLLLSHAELSKLKQKLNAEFTATTKGISSLAEDNTSTTAVHTSPVPLPVSGEKASTVAGGKKKSVKIEGIKKLRA